MLTIKTLHCGSDQVSTQFPIRDFDRAFTLDVNGGVGTSLDAGHWEIRSNVDFEYTIVPSEYDPDRPDGNVKVPHDANVWLGLSLERNSGISISAAGEGRVWFVPMKVTD